MLFVTGNYQSLSSLYFWSLSYFWKLYSWWWASSYFFSDFGSSPTLHAVSLHSHIIIIIIIFIAITIITIITIIITWPGPRWISWVRFWLLASGLRRSARFGLFLDSNFFNLNFFQLSTLNFHFSTSNFQFSTYNKKVKKRFLKNLVLIFFFLISTFFNIIFCSTFSLGGSLFRQSSSLYIYISYHNYNHSDHNSHQHDNDDNQEGFGARLVVSLCPSLSCCSLSPNLDTWAQNGRY